MPARRAKAPEEYEIEFVSNDHLKAVTTKAASPWTPVLENFVKSGQAATQIKVANAREGNRLAGQLRRQAGQWFPNHKLGAKTISIPTSNGGSDYFASLIITARSEK